MGTAEARAHDAEIEAATEPPAILSALVRRHLQANKNNRAKAMRGAVAEILADETLLNDVLREVVSETVDRYVRRDLTNQRHRAVSAAMDITKDAKKRAAESFTSLMNFPMRSGGKLQTAKRPEVGDTSAHYLRSGSVHVQRGLWLQAVAERLPNDDVTVGLAMDATALSGLFNAAVKRVQKMGLPYGG
jgi:hypothetical protein